MYGVDVGLVRQRRLGEIVYIYNGSISWDKVLGSGDRTKPWHEVFGPILETDCFEKGLGESFWIKYLVQVLGPSLGTKSWDQIRRKLLLLLSISVQAKCKKVDRVKMNSCSFESVYSENDV